MFCFSTVGKSAIVYVAIAKDQLYDVNILLQSVNNFMTRLKAHSAGLSSYPAGNSRGLPHVACDTSCFWEGKVSCSLVCFDKGSVTM